MVRRARVSLVARSPAPPAQATAAFTWGLLLRALKFAFSPCVALVDAVSFIIGVLSIIAFTIINGLTMLITECLTFAGMIVLPVYHFLLDVCSTSLGVLLVPLQALAGLFIRCSGGLLKVFSGLLKFAVYAFCVRAGIFLVEQLANNYTAVSQIDSLIKPLALDEVEKELDSTHRYLVNPNGRLRDIAFIKTDLSQRLSQLDAVNTDGLSDAGERKQKYAQQINRILERIQALGY